jgi:hypothetical protein
VNRAPQARIDQHPAVDLPVPVLSAADGGTPVSGLVSLTYAAWVRVLAELARMVPYVGDTAGSGCLRKVRTAAGEYLRRIEESIVHGGIQPWSPIRLAPDAPMPPLSPSASKVGVFPLSASPFEWAHLLAGLAAMAHLGLDHVVYIVTEGADQGSSLLPREVRHAMTRDLLGRFPPLLLYSPVGFQQDNAGPLSFFRLLALNASQPMEVYLITGGTEGGIGDHPSEELVGRIRSAMAERRGGYDESMHPVTLVVAKQEDVAHAAGRSPARVSVEFPMPSVLPGAIPAALSGDAGRDALAALPYTAFRHLRRLWTYSARPRAEYSPLPG